MSAVVDFSQQIRISKLRLRESSFEEFNFDIKDVSVNFYFIVKRKICHLYAKNFHNFHCCQSEFKNNFWEIHMMSEATEIFWPNLYPVVL